MTNPITIYDALVAKLGRAPTSAELKADVKRIFDANEIERLRQLLAEEYSNLSKPQLESIAAHMEMLRRKLLITTRL